jgi:hypothetical protein
MIGPAPQWTQSGVRAMLALVATLTTNAAWILLT